MSVLNFPFKTLKGIDAYCKKNGVNVKRLRFRIAQGTTSGIVLSPRAKVKKTVVVFHSLGADKLYPFSELFLTFLKMDIRVCSIDWDGHGAENTHLMQLPDLLETPAYITAEIENRFSISKSDIILFGHSAGGLSCLFEASRNYYAGLITISTPHSFCMGIRVLFELFSLLHPQVWRQLRYYSLYELIPAFYSFKRKRFPIRLGDDGKNYIEKVSKLFEQMSILKEIEHARTSFLQIHGKIDAIIPFKQAQEIHHCYSGPKKLYSLPFDNHFTTLFSIRTIREVEYWIQNL